MSKHKIKTYNSKKQIINFVKFDLWDNNMLLKTKLKSKRLFKKLYGSRRKRGAGWPFKQQMLIKKYSIVDNKVILKSNVISYYSKVFLKLYNLYLKKKKITKKNLNLIKFLKTKFLGVFQKKKYNFLKYINSNFSSIKKKRKFYPSLLLFKLQKLFTKYKSKKLPIKIKKFKKVIKLFHIKKRLKQLKKNCKIIQKKAKLQRKEFRQRRKKRVALPLYFDYVQKKFITVKEYMTMDNLRLNRYNNDFLHTYFGKYIIAREHLSKRKTKYNYSRTDQTKLGLNYVKNIGYINSLLNIRKIYVYQRRKKYNQFAKAIMQKQFFKKYFYNISTKKLKNFYKKINNLFKHKINKLNSSFLYNLEYTIFFFMLRSKLIKDHFDLKLFIEQGNIFVNNKKIFNQFYRLKIGDIITFDPNSWTFLKQNFFKFKISKIRRPLSHIMISFSILKLIFIKKPKLNELKYTFKITNSFLNYLNRNKLN